MDETGTRLDEIGTRLGRDWNEIGTRDKNKGQACEEIDNGGTGPGRDGPNTGLNDHEGSHQKLPKQYECTTCESF